LREPVGAGGELREHGENVLVLGIPHRAPAGDRHGSAGREQLVVERGIGEPDGLCIGNRVLELDQRDVGVGVGAFGEVIRIDDDLVALDFFGLGAVDAAIADHNGIVGLDVFGRGRIDDDAVGRGQHPLRGDDRAAAAAFIIVHRCKDPHLPGKFAVRRDLAADDHLVVVGSGKAVQSQEHSKRQQTIGNKLAYSRHGATPARFRVEGPRHRGSTHWEFMVLSIQSVKEETRV
jgi:hypothetical protein